MEKRLSLPQFTKWAEVVPCVVLLAQLLVRLLLLWSKKSSAD